MGRRNKTRRRQPVTLKAVAESVGLATGTASLILNRAPQSMSIPQATKDRVFAAALKLNYRPNPIARALRAGKPPALADNVSLNPGSRALLFGGEKHFMLALNAIRKAGLRVPEDVSIFGADVTAGSAESSL
ncbi:MAG: LacI family DNA-binding transcriptional regulator [Candidatus Sulfotelmatobacter sp.]